MLKLRAQQIVIDLQTEHSPVWVSSTIQHVIKDSHGLVIQTVDDVGRINRCMNDVALDVTTITDPVTGQEITMSAAGAAEAVKAFMIKWMQEDFNGTINEQNELIANQ